MKFSGENLYHIYNQGNNRQQIFFERKNYFYFLKKMRMHLLPYCDILAWCLMPNHFHWMIWVPAEYDKITNQDKSTTRPLNKAVATILSSYTKGVNKAYQRSGSLFRSQTKAKPLLTEDDDYQLTCFFYIHQNPIRSNLSKALGQWEFSSYREYTAGRNEGLCNKARALKLLDLPREDEEFRKLSLQTIDERYLEELF